MGGVTASVRMKYDGTSHTRWNGRQCKSVTGG